MHVRRLTISRLRCVQTAAASIAHDGRHNIQYRTVDSADDVSDRRLSQFFLRVTQCQATRSNSDCRHILSSSSSGLWSLGSSMTGERHAGITTGSLASTPQPGNGCHTLNCTAFEGGAAHWRPLSHLLKIICAMLIGKTHNCVHVMLIGFPVRSEWGVDPLLRRLHSCWWITGIPSAIRFDSINPH